MGYHKLEIPKGVLGQFSKITEEYIELSDAIQQNDKVLTICELTDLIGAIGHFAKQYNLSLDDLIAFNKKTESAFKEGKR